MRSILEAFAVPHTPITYVDVGKVTLLYIVSLLSREGLDLLLRRGLRRPNFLFRSVHFSFVWGFHVNQAKRVLGWVGLSASYKLYRNGLRILT